jgi:hypothetical protein
MNVCSPMFFHMNPSISTLCEMKYEMKWAAKRLYGKSKDFMHNEKRPGLLHFANTFSNNPFLCSSAAYLSHCSSYPGFSYDCRFNGLYFTSSLVLPLMRYIHRFDVYGGTEAVELRYYSWRCKFAATIIFIVWFAMMLVGCLLWKRYVDTFAICCSRRAEEILMGKQREVKSDSAITQNFDEP